MAHLAVDTAAVEPCTSSPVRGLGVEWAVFSICRHWLVAGRDATEDFDSIGHSKSAVAMLDKYYIGDVEVRMPCGAMLGGLFYADWHVVRGKRLKSVMDPYACCTG